MKFWFPYASSPRCLKDVSPAVRHSGSVHSPVGAHVVRDAMALSALIPSCVWRRVALIAGAKDAPCFLCSSSGDDLLKSSGLVCGAQCSLLISLRAHSLDLDLLFLPLFLLLSPARLAFRRPP